MLRQAAVRAARALPGAQVLASSRCVRCVSHGSAATRDDAQVDDAALEPREPAAASQPAASRDAAWQQLAFPGLREHVEKLIGDNFKKTYGLDQAKLFKLVAEASSKEEATEALNTIHRAWVWRTAAPRGSLRRWHNALGFEFVDKCIGIGASGVALDAARRAWEVGFVVRAPLFHRVMEAMIEEGDVAGLIMTYAAMKDNVVAPTQATGAILVGGLRGAGREELAAAVEEEFKLNGVPIAGADA